MDRAGSTVSGLPLNPNPDTKPSPSPTSPKEPAPSKYSLPSSLLQMSISAGSMLRALLSLSGAGRRRGCVLTPNSHASTSYQDRPSYRRPVPALLPVSGAATRMHHGQGFVQTAAPSQTNSCTQLSGQCEIPSLAIALALQQWHSLAEMQSHVAEQSVAVQRVVRCPSQHGSSARRTCNQHLELDARRLQNLPEPRVQAQYDADVSL